MTAEQKSTLYSVSLDKTDSEQKKILVQAKAAL